MSKIQAELVAATGVKVTKDRPKFLLALHTAVMKLPDEGWDKLSDPAQKWANGVTKDIEAKRELSDFPDVAAAEEAEEPAPKTERAKPAAKPAAAKPKPAAKEKATRPAPAPKAKKAPGRIEQMKAIMLSNLGVKADDLKAKLVAAGIEVSDATITTVRSDFMSTIRVLKAKGKLSEDFVAKLDKAAE